MSTQARWAGKCASCGSGILAGEWIETTDDGSIHVGCVEQGDVPLIGSVCSTCWLVHPEGGCDRQ